MKKNAYLSIGLTCAIFITACQSTGGNDAKPLSLNKLQDGAIFSGASEELERDGLKADIDAQNQLEIVERISKFYDVNPSYKPLAKALTEAGFSAASFSLEARKFSKQALRQARLPQTRPDLSIDKDGNAVGRLLFEQLLIGSGRLRAEKLILTAQEAQALAEYRIEANEDMAEGFSTYLNMSRYKKLAAESDKIVSIYESFLEKAEARVKGGVANRNEVRLFELKTAQAKAQQSEFAAEYTRYKAQFEALTASLVPNETINRIQFGDLTSTEATSQTIKKSPLYQLRVAMLDQVVGETVREKVARRPELSLTGSLGGGSSLGLGADNNINNARIGLTVSKPFVWGKDLNIKAYEADVKAAEAETLRQLRKITIELNAIEKLLQSYQSQLAAKQSVADLAEQRAISFQNDFKAGAVGIIEAVSMLETLKTVKLDYIETEFLVYETDVLKAETLGLLGPFYGNPTQ